MTPIDGHSEMTPDEIFDDHEVVSACLQLMDEKGMAYDQRLVVVTTLVAYTYLKEMTKIVDIFDFCIEYGHVLRTAIGMIEGIGLDEFRGRIDGGG